MSGPLPDIFDVITRPASWMYGAAIAARNRRFDRGRGVERVPVPVVSVGNISAGGSGKSPMVAWLARRLQEADVRPAIAMRGYAATADAGSDERAEYAERVPDVDVVVGADRVAALRAYLPEHPDVACVLLDDGFQHRCLHRDLDLVLVDATRPPDRDRLIPAGYLREPMASLRRADAVIVTRADAVDPALAATIAGAHGAEPAAWSRHDWPRLDVHDPGGTTTGVERDWLRGRRVLTLFGIGNPAAANAQVVAAGADIVERVPARDHEAYGASKLDRVRDRAAGVDAVVMTGKDWVKVRRLIDLSRWPVPIVVPELALDVYEGAQALLDRVLDVVRSGPAT
jgi:tetraacyldisaccharide 4'-kinase